MVNFSNHKLKPLLRISWLVMSDLQKLSNLNEIALLSDCSAKKERHSKNEINSWDSFFKKHFTHIIY